MVTTLLPAIFFLSGCSALLFENLWFYQAGITFGNSIWASSLVLAGFMGGLALGNALAARLRPGAFRAIRTYGMLEGAIGVFGFALVVGLPPLTSLIGSILAPVLASGWIVNPLRLAFAFVLLLVPSTAMGATLPVMVSALYQQDHRFGPVLGRLYGWNTIGAVVGALAGDLALIEAVGVRGTGLIAAGISLSVASLALLLSRRFEDQATMVTHAQSPAPRLSASGRLLLVAAAIAGFSLLGLEVAWFRFLLHFLFGSRQAFAVLLATVLAGIGVGGLFGGYLASVEGRPARLLAGTAMLTGVVCLALYQLYPAGAPVHTLGETLVYAAPLMFPVSLLSGVLFTLLGAALKREEARETRAAGLLTLANTTGAMLGPLFVGFFLLPEFGVDRCIQVLSGLYLLMGMIVVAAGAQPQRSVGVVTTSVIGAALALLVAAFPVGPTLERHLQPVIEPHLAGKDARVVGMHEGLTETIIYIEEDRYGEPVSYRMLTNGYSMSSTDLLGLRYMKLFVYLPMALHPDAKSALLISYGVGNTAKALTNSAGLESIDVVDTSRDVLEMNEIVFPNPDELPLNDPRMQVHIEDGRYFLQTTQKRFDLITGEPPPPKIAGIVSLYTQEYFSLVHDRLSEGGIVSYWLPAHLLTQDDAKSIIRAFCGVFADCTLWGGAGFDWILLGTRNATGPGDTRQLIRQWLDPKIRADLDMIGVERPEQLGALFMAGPDDLAQIASDVAPLTDDRPKRLSDEWFDLEKGLQSYVPWLDVNKARKRFEADPWIRKVWPPELRAPTSVYFPVQGEINVQLIPTVPRPLQDTMLQLHAVLTGSSLATLPLWMLGSNGLRQRAAQRALDEGQRDPQVFWELARGALASRHYARAAELFERGSKAAGGAGPYVRVLSLYSLLMADDANGQRELIRHLEESGSERALEPWVIPFLKASAQAQ
jgi:spermidine synthase